MENFEITPEQSIAALRADKERGRLTPEHIKMLGEVISSDVRPSVIDNLQADEDKEAHELSPEQQATLFAILKARFEANPHRHEGIEWDKVEVSLKAAPPEKLWTIHQLEENGGEPDIFMNAFNGFIIGDCYGEAPECRSDIVFDREAEKMLKEGGKCNGNATDMVAKWGAEFMSGPQYRHLGSSGAIDKTGFSYLRTSADIRKAGRAMHGYYGEGGHYQVYECNADHHRVKNGVRCVVEIKWAA